MAELTSMRNIGREMARKLKAAGIGTPEELRRAGAKEAYLRIRMVFPNVCLVHLYVLEGAIEDVEYNRLPEGKKADLRAFSSFLRSGRE